MCWNHRVIYSDGYYSIHECFYEKEGDIIPNMWTEPIDLGGEESLDDLRTTLAWMLECR